MLTAGMVTHDTSGTNDSAAGVLCQTFYAPGPTSVPSVGHLQARQPDLLRSVPGLPEGGVLL